MPWYNYKCTSCNHIEWEVKRPITENVGLYECPKCKGEMKQIYSIFGFELKGDGWYKDGYSHKIPHHIKQKDRIDDLSK